MANIQVAIDGPAGSGKSSICKMVAERLNFTHIDTGALFRAITLYALNKPKKLKIKECKYLYLGTEQWIDLMGDVDKSDDVFVMKLKDFEKINQSALVINRLKKYSKYNLDILHSLIDAFYNSDIVLKEIAWWRWQSGHTCSHPEHRS